MRVFQTPSQKWMISALAMVFVVIGPPKVSATPIPLGGGGVLNISNLTGTLVGVSNACINWGYPAACTATPVLDSVSGSDAAVFTVGSNALDTIKDLPASLLLPLVDFQTVQSPILPGVVHFDLTSIVIPTTPAGNNCTTFALSAVCTPGGGSPFTLFQQSSDQVAITLALTENAYTGTSGSGITPYNSIFTTQLSGTLSNGQTVTIPNILALIGGGGTITGTWSATESPIAVPEPTQFLLLSSGLIGLALFRRRIG